MKGKNVVVIGAGNTAIDGATCSVRLGAENVKILYRRTIEEMTAYDFEYEFAKQDGVEFRWLTAASEVFAMKKETLKELNASRWNSWEPAEDGRKRTEPIPRTQNSRLTVDAVVKAIGQTRHPFIEQLRTRS